MLDDHTDRLQKNLHMIKRKEEATAAAREEIKAQSLREMQLQSEVNTSKLEKFNQPESQTTNITTMSIFSLREC